MNSLRVSTAMATALAALLGCSTNGGVVVVDQHGQDVGSEVALDGTTEARQEVDVLRFPDVELVEDEVFDQCLPGDGCFGEPCQDGGDCLSGICVEHQGNKVCSQQCVEECPDGFSCTEVGARGPDVVWLCISDFRVLCRPCEGDSDCSSDGGEDRCLDYGPDGRFCGGVCNAAIQCPDGYECLADGPDGGSQCILVDGECPCSAQSVWLGASTICEFSNESGTCAGQRFCSEDGLSPCNAPEPAGEVCNGIDDNCDGAVDEATCDDQNSCTDDSCAGETGCVQEPLTGTNCDDQDACTLTDHCEDGECTGTLIACDDNNPCTDDSCDGAAGCIFAANVADCDDGDPCTIGDQCQAEECVGVPVSCQCDSNGDCGAYEDGNLCNGTLYCDKTGVEFQCKVDPETVVTCPAPGSPCLTAICQPQNGTCQNEPANSGFACDDGDACTYGEACDEGDCHGGQSLNCNDGNGCTLDSCDELTGCKHQSVSGDCSDGNACTWPDVCAQGECIAGDGVDCDDANPCTADSCNPGKGCVHTPTGGGCDDGNVCTVGDHCEGGLCVPSKALDCDDADVCSNDSCAPATGCLHEFNTAPCSDGDLCTVNDSCLAGACLGGKSLSCDDGNQCTSDSCNQLVGCVYTDNAGACDDLDPCTEEDACSGGVCVGTAPKDCDDGNPCTDDVCTPMAGCSHNNNQNPCNDNNICTVNDQCAKGQCVPGPAANCSDGNGCTDDGCDPDIGCTHEANDAACDDDNPCTLDESCVGGKCKAGATLDCSDNNYCTDDICDPAEGCEHTFNTLPCTDGDACTLGDTCDMGGCVGTADKVCNDFNVCTDDNCDPQEGCQFGANQEACTDGNACTDGDQCGDGWCHPGVVLDCTDDNPCTDDLCNLQAGCVHELNADSCEDGDFCTVGDVCAAGVCEPGEVLNCDDENPCTDDSCTPGLGCVHTSNAEACDDGTVCTDGDVCADGACVPGGALDCADENSCTEDSCDAEQGCLHVEMADDTVCADDGNSCTTDVCSAGVCTHSGDGWSGYGDHCYRYFTEKKTWAAARAACQGHGGDLGSIKDAAENSFVHGLIDPTEDAPWIGFNDIASEGSWKWSDSTPNTYTNWSPSEPNNSGNEDCTHLYSYAGKPYDGKWNDLKCGTAISYLCEKP